MKVNSITCILTIILSFNCYGGQNSKHKSLTDMMMGGTHQATIEENIYNGATYINATVGGNTRHDVNYGVSLQGFNGDVKFSDQSVAVYQFTSKNFNITDDIQSTIGYDVGFNVPGNVHTSTLQLYYFEDNSFKYNKLQLSGGMFWANQNLTSTTSYIGLHVGVEYDIIHNMVKVNSDYYGGHSSISGYDCIISIVLPNKINIIYFGVNVNTVESGNVLYGIVGLSLIL